MAENIVLLRPLRGNFAVTQGFGENAAFYQAHPEWKIRAHNGIDYGCPEGTPVYAAHDGQVGRIGFEDGGYGNFVRVNTRWGRVIDAHLDQYVVAMGQVIVAGDFIGYSGNTGCSTGPHLHHEIRLDGMENNGFNGAVDATAYETEETSPLTPLQNKNFGEGDKTLLQPSPQDGEGEKSEEPRTGYASWEGEGVKTGRVAIASLNVRDGVGTGANLVGTVLFGKTVKVDKSMRDALGNTWVHGTIEDVWMAAEYDGESYLTLVV
jgi:hypothetical protein